MQPVIDVGKLLKLRASVARYGEMDGARWWNTRGQLGRLGAVALRRGFPRTHRFAQARAVFAVAARRCEEVFHPPGTFTLWSLPAAVEEQFDACWEGWLDDAQAWEPFFSSLETVPPCGLDEWLVQLGVVLPEAVRALEPLKREAGGRAVRVPSTDALSDDLLQTLALCFSKSEPGALAVPYVSVGG